MVLCYHVTNDQRFKALAFRLAVGRQWMDMPQTVVNH